MIAKLNWIAVHHRVFGQEASDSFQLMHSLRKKRVGWKSVSSLCHLIVNLVHRPLSGRLSWADGHIGLTALQILKSYLLCKIQLLLPFRVRFSYFFMYYEKNFQTFFLFCIVMLFMFFFYLFLWRLVQHHILLSCSSKKIEFYHIILDVSEV